MTGEELKKLIVDKGFVLNDLAKELGITPQLLNRRLSVKAVKLDFIEKVEAALNIKLMEKPQADDGMMSAFIRLLQKKDEQIDRLIRLLEEERAKNNNDYQKENVG